MTLCRVAECAQHQSRSRYGKGTTLCTPRTSTWQARSTPHTLHCAPVVVAMLLMMVAMLSWRRKAKRTTTDATQHPEHRCGISPASSQGSVQALLFLPLAHSVRGAGVKTLGVSKYLQIYFSTLLGCNRQCTNNSAAAVDCPSPAGSSGNG